MRYLRTIFISMLLAGVLLTLAWGQEDTSMKPVDAYPPVGQENTTAADANVQQNQQEISPDTNPPTGAQELTLGSLESGRNYLNGSFRFNQMANFNNNGSQWGTVTNLIGQMALNRTGKSSSFALQYGGAGFIPTNQHFGASQAQQLGISETLTGGRWSLFLADEAVYSPEGGYGFGGLGLAGGFGSQIFTGLSPNLANQQTALVEARRVGNTSLAQVQYKLSARSSITAFGTYGLLHFVDPGFIDSNQVLGQIGYNYSPTRHDTVSLSYGYGQFHFGGGTNSGLKSHSLDLGYVRRITGRLTFDLAAGPQLIFTQSFVTVPILQLGPFIIYGTTKENFRRLSWSGRSNVQYSLGRNHLTLSYLRAVTGGSGVLAGAQTSAGQAAIEHIFNHSWSGGLNFGYAHNGALAAASGGYSSLYGGARMQRHVGREGDLSFSYRLQRQQTSRACSASVCGLDLLQHIIGVGFQWQFRPIRLD